MLTKLLELREAHPSHGYSMEFIVDIQIIGGATKTQKQSYQNTKTPSFHIIWGFHPYLAMYKCVHSTLVKWKTRHENAQMHAIHSTKSTQY